MSVQLASSKPAEWHHKLYRQTIQDMLLSKNLLGYACAFVGHAQFNTNPAQYVMTAAWHFENVQSVASSAGQSCVSKCHMQSKTGPLWLVKHYLQLGSWLDVRALSGAETAQTQPQPICSGWCMCQHRHEHHHASFHVSIPS